MRCNIDNNALQQTNNNNIMKKLLTVLTAIMAIIQGVSAQTSGISTPDETGLPVVNIETVDGEEPTCEYITHPEGAMGESIANATKVPGRVTVSKAGTVIFDSGDYEKSVSGMTVKIRGNTSAYASKKPFKIKLQKKADMLCRGDKNFNDKNWVLLNNTNTLNTLIGMKVSELTGVQWVPQLQYVNLVFNGEYRGLYILIEGVERNETARVNVDKDGGYIVEADPYWWKEDVYFDTGYTGMDKKYTFKYPDTDDITPEQIDEIKRCIEAMEKSIGDGTYPEHIDVASFATWLITHDILGTWDSAGSNIFMTRKNSSSKLEMGPLWDFDTIMKMEGAWARVHNDFFYFQQLFDNSNKTFARTYKETYGRLRTSVFDDITAFIDSYVKSDDAAALDRAYELENRLLGYDNTTVAEMAAGLRQWFSGRRTWLDSAVSTISTDETGITEISRDDQSLSGTLHDLTGRRVSDSYKGLVINGKRKMIVR